MGGAKQIINNLRTENLIISIKQKTINAKYAELTHPLLSLAQEVDDNEMKDDVSEDEIRETTFRWYWTKLNFICRIYLNKQII